MADSQETRVLKDINRHLKSINDATAKTGITDTLSPSESAALNKNVQEVMGNFSSLVNTELKNTIKATNRAFVQAFGNLKGFSNNEEQVLLMDEMVDELKMNNDLVSKAEQNKFLRESERETDLNVNRRTNDLLEDILEKDEDAMALAKADSDSTKSFLSGGVGGLFGGLFAGKSIKGLLGGIKGLGKKVFFPLLIAGAGVEFLRGWSEAGNDASTLSKFNSAIGRMASDLSFGLVSKEFFTNALEGIQGAIGSAWASFTKNWDEFVSGKISSPDFFANILSDLTTGILSPAQIKQIGQQIEDGMSDLVKTVVNAIVTGLVDPLVEQMSEQFSMLFDDPIGFFKQRIDVFKEKLKQDAIDVSKRAKELQKEEGLSEKAALRQAAIEKSIQKQGFVGRIAGNTVFDLIKKLGFASETQEESDLKAKEEREKIELKAARAEARRIRLAEGQRKRLAEIKAARAEPAKVSSEALKMKIDNERALQEFKKQENSGNAMQVNNLTTTVAPVDKSTENDDAVNLQRSSGASGGW